MPEVSKLRTYFANNNHVLMFVSIVIIAVFMTRGSFLNPDYLSVVLATAAVFGLLALGQGVVIISGGFDLSVGALVALSISVVANLKNSLGIVNATIIMLAVSTFMGVINGILISNTRIPAFIVTLGMMSIANSMSLMLIPGQQIRVGEYKEFFEPVLSWMPFGSNSFPIVLITVFALVFSILMNGTRFGRYIYAIGSNEQTAIASGVPVRIAKIKTYALSGFMCGIGAIAYLFRNISAAPGSTADYLLLSIASTMIGGISMYGGTGSVGGIVLGIISLASINSVLIVAGIPPALHKAVLGGIVLFSASFQWLSKHKA